MILKLLHKIDEAWHGFLMSFFKGIVLRYPLIMILCLAVITGILGYGIRYFRLDASAETLVLQNDKDLQYTREINGRYGERDILILTFSPNGDILSNETLSSVRGLRDRLKAIKGIESVTTILDVPLLESPPIPLKEMAEVTRTLESADVNKEMARKELRESPLYSDRLVSSDMKTMAILITFPVDSRYDELLQRRNKFLDEERSGKLSRDKKAQMHEAVKEFAAYHDAFREQRHQQIASIRSVMDMHRGDGKLFLGGVSMIADDMISFIKKDLKVFGTVVFILMTLTIAIIFRRLHWVLTTMLICAVSITWTIGILGWAGWEVTVISSNFISLQLIITLAMTIHLMVHYRELCNEMPQEGRDKLTIGTIETMLRPCVYSELTTIAGFASLIFCDIKPVIDFGYIMVVGVAISTIVPFLLLPVLLLHLPKDKPRVQRISHWLPAPILGRSTLRHGPVIIALSIVLLVLNAIGISRLKVENCFVNYFKSKTEINQGLRVLDQKLGGTTLLDVVLDLGPIDSNAAVLPKQAESEAGEFDEFEEFETTGKKYWFTPEKLGQISAVHDYLDGLPETGKVLSTVTLVRMIERANSRPLDNLELSLLFNLVPQRISDMLVNPYVSVENNQVRIAVWIHDTMPGLERNELLKKIRTDLTDKFGFKPEQVHLAGIMVLYNNMLQSLFSSQIVTMGFATLSLMGAFVVLFRSIKIAVIAIFPNLLAVSCVLGVMGWLNIPLDMMTITIAAIGVGLADDDTIHYIHRFKHEVELKGNYKKAILRSHNSIGHAIYYTTATLVVGFSILSLSNFIPTIYFGLLTVLAITMALLGSLTLLPELLILVKPYGKKTDTNQKSIEGEKQ